MTREEEINNASYAYWGNNYANIEFIDEEEKELHTQDIQDSFINGAEWADSHPHWISVNEDLPKINPNDSEWEYSDDVIVVLKDDSVAVGRYERDNSTGEHYWVNFGVDKDLVVTRWMPLPQAPHHIIDANKKVDRVIGTADHIKTALDVLNKKGGEK